VNLLMYENFCKKRLSRIKQIFGDRWFDGKRVVDLGCSSGDIGIALAKLGSKVTVVDRDNNKLSNIKRYFDTFNHRVDTIHADLNYIDINQHYDLSIHMGLLYLLEDWRKSLRNTIKNSNITILESSLGTSRCDLSEDNIELYLNKLGAKYIKYADPDLNSLGWDGNTKLYHLYDWNKEQGDSLREVKIIDGIKHHTHFRRMWLIMR